MAQNYRPPGGYYGQPTAPPPYQQPVPHHHTVVVQQPVIVQPKQPTVRHVSDRLVRVLYMFRKESV